MKYLCLIRWTEDGAPLTAEEGQALVREHMAYDAKLQLQGHFVAAGSLELEDAAIAVRVRQGRLSATDGPFVETKEHLAGFYVLQARDREEAVRLAAGIPSARTGWIEVRPFHDLFGDLHPEVSGSPPQPQEDAPMPNTPSVKLAAPRFQSTPPMKLTGLLGSFTPETMRDIAALWPRFMDQLMGAKIAGVGRRVSFGAGFHCFDGSPGFQYLCAVEVSDFTGVPAGWARISVPARRYAVFAHDDHVSRLGDAIHAVHDDWLPASGHAAAMEEGAPDFLERYGERFDPAAGKGDVEIWFPIRS